MSEDSTLWWPWSLLGTLATAMAVPLIVLSNILLGDEPEEVLSRARAVEKIVTAGESFVFQNFPGDRLYTFNALVEELALIERHLRDGSWKLCKCNPEKHLPLVAGLSSEGVGFALNEDERSFMVQMMNKARIMRDKITSSKFGDQDAEELRTWARKQRHRITERRWKGAMSETPELDKFRSQTLETRAQNDDEEGCPSCPIAVGMGYAFSVAEELGMPDWEILYQEFAEERVTADEAMNKIVSYAQEKDSSDHIESLIEIYRLMTTPLSELENEVEAQ